MAQAHDERTQRQLAEADRLYEQYAKPLEKDHNGEYIVVSSRGKYLLGTKLHDVVDAADRQFGPDNFVFKLGETAAVTWRWHRIV
jgi:hypothetical protein